eukprot:g9125.t1
MLSLLIHWSLEGGLRVLALNVSQPALLQPSPDQAQQIFEATLLQLQNAESAWLPVANPGTYSAGKTAIQTLGVPFGSSSLAGQCSSSSAGSGTSFSGQNCFDNINDGKTGNANSWINNGVVNGKAFAGVTWEYDMLLQGFCTSRDMTGALQDRFAGNNAFQYSLQPLDQRGEDSAWTTVETFVRAHAGLHCYAFTKPVLARSVRLTTDSNGAAFDELQLLAADFDCNILPASMSGAAQPSGCAGAVLADGTPSREYCESDSRFLWWQSCCTWTGTVCVDKRQRTGWHLAPKGAPVCDYGVTVSARDCAAAVSFLASKAGRVPGRQMATGSGGTCGDGAWGQVPLGCSAQTGTDFTAHYKPTGTNCPNQNFQLVCTVQRDYHLAPAGSSSCDFGTIVSLSECEAAVIHLAQKAKQVLKRRLVIGNGGTCGDGAWGQVPHGCSSQTGFDWAPHYKAAGTNCPNNLFQLVCTSRACDFKVQSYGVFDGVYKASNLMQNGLPVYVHGDNPLQVWQRGSDGWDLCLRTSQTSPSTCAGSVGRAGFASHDLTLKRPQLGPLFNWGSVPNSMVVSCYDSCAFRVENSNSGYEGLYYKSTEIYNNKPVYIKEDFPTQVFQDNGADGWSLCSRLVNWGPGNCANQCPPDFPFPCVKNDLPGSKACFNQATHAATCSLLVGTWCALNGAASSVTAKIDSREGKWCYGSEGSCTPLFGECDSGKGQLSSLQNLGGGDVCSTELTDCPVGLCGPSFGDCACASDDRRVCNEVTGICGDSSVLQRAQPSTTFNYLPYHLAPAGNEVCDYGANLAEENCLEAGLRVLPRNTGRERNFLVSDATSDNGGAQWCLVPRGCSVQTGGDFAGDYAVYYNKAIFRSECPKNNYRLICTNEIDFEQKANTKCGGTSLNDKWDDGWPTGYGTLVSNVETCKRICAAHSDCAGFELRSLPGDELARNKPTNQSTDQTQLGWTAFSSLAVDGNNDTNFNRMSCSCTLQGASWWRVDLGRTARVNYVEVWNRGDCCPERLNGYQVWVGDTDTSPGQPFNKEGMTQCSQGPNVPAGGTGRTECNGFSGRYVFITVANSILSLCEVKVYGFKTSCSYWTSSLELSSAPNTVCYVKQVTQDKRVCDGQSCGPHKGHCYCQQQAPFCSHAGVCGVSYYASEYNYNPSTDCEEMCRSQGYCCANGAVSENHLFSCTQACLIRQKGQSEAKCLNHCQRTKNVVCKLADFGTSAAREKTISIDGKLNCPLYVSQANWAPPEDFTLLPGQHCGGSSITSGLPDAEGNIVSYGNAAAADLESCKAICLASPTCDGFVLRDSDGVCAFWKKGPLNPSNTAGHHCYRKNKNPLQARQLYDLGCASLDAGECCKYKDGRATGGYLNVDCIPGTYKSGSTCEPETYARLNEQANMGKCGGESFKVVQTGSKLVVTRTDVNAGWDMNLKFQCCERKCQVSEGTTLEVCNDPADCYLEYCNAHEDLKNAFCGRETCNTKEHAHSCRIHWFTWGFLEQRLANPTDCALAKAYFPCPKDYPFAYRPQQGWDACCASDKDSTGTSFPYPQRASTCFQAQSKPCVYPPCVDYSGVAVVGHERHDWNGVAIFGGERYELDGPCVDIDPDNPKCTQAGVPDASACEAGCRLYPPIPKRYTLVKYSSSVCGGAGWTSGYSEPLTAKQCHDLASCLDWCENKAYCRCVDQDADKKLMYHRLLYSKAVTATADRTAWVKVLTGTYQANVNQTCTGNRAKVWEDGTATHPLSTNEVWDCERLCNLHSDCSGFELVRGAYCWWYTGAIGLAAAKDQVCYIKPKEEEWRLLLKQDKCPSCNFLPSQALYSYTSKPYVCANSENILCDCEGGTIYYGRKFVTGKPGSGDTTSLEQLQDTPFASKKGGVDAVNCADSVFGAVLAGFTKYCYCVPGQKYSVLAELDDDNRRIDGKFEFKLLVNNVKSFYWKQSTHPLAQGPVEGYEALGVDDNCFQGLHQVPNALSGACADGPTGHGTYTIGSYESFPVFPGIQTVTSLQLFVKSVAYHLAPAGSSECNHGISPNENACESSSRVAIGPLSSDRVLGLNGYMRVASQRFEGADLACYKDHDCDIKYGTDHTGGNHVDGSACCASKTNASPAANEKACCARCHGSPQCTTWVFQPSTGNCWLTNAKNVGYAARADRSSGKISRDGRAMERCVRECDESEHCTGVQRIYPQATTWGEGVSGCCVVGAMTISKTTVSGVDFFAKKAFVPPGFERVPGTSPIFPEASDIATYKDGRDVWECLKLCSARPACSQVVYVYPESPEWGLDVAGCVLKGHLGNNQLTPHRDMDTYIKTGAWGPEISSPGALSVATCEAGKYPVKCSCMGACEGALFASPPSQGQRCADCGVDNQATTCVVISSVPSAPVTAVVDCSITPTRSFNTVPKDGSVSQGCWENGVDYFGNDISDPLSIESAASCQALCQNRSCIYWSYKENLQRCWLKRSKAGWKLEAGTISGPKLCGLASCPSGTVLQSCSCWAANGTCANLAPVLDREQNACKLPNENAGVAMLQAHCVQPMCPVGFWYSTLVPDPVMQTETADVASIDDCAAKCLRQPECTMFQYAPQGGKCKRSAGRLSSVEVTGAVSCVRTTSAKTMGPYQDMKFNSEIYFLVGSTSTCSVNMVALPAAAMPITPWCRAYTQPECQGWCRSEPRCYAVLYRSTIKGCYLRAFTESLELQPKNGCCADYTVSVVSPRSAHFLLGEVQGCVKHCELKYPRETSFDSGKPWDNYDLGFCRRGCGVTFLADGVVPVEVAESHIVWCPQMFMPDRTVNKQACLLCAEACSADGNYAACQYGCDFWPDATAPIFQVQGSEVADGIYPQVRSQECRVMPGQDPSTGFEHIEGGYIADVSTDEECNEQCLSFPACKFWARKTPRGPCWVSKAAITKFKTATDRTVGFPCMKAQCSERGIGYTGNDIGSFTSKSSLDCQLACLTQGGCRFWTYVKSRSECSLKTSDAGRGQTACDQCISGPKSCDTPRYWGCFQNEFDARIKEHLDGQTLDSCRKLAALSSSFFALEYPEKGKAECLILESGVPNLPRRPDGECEKEKDAQGNRMGGSYRMAVYGLSPPGVKYCSTANCDSEHALIILPQLDKWQICPSGDETETCPRFPQGFAELDCASWCAIEAANRNLLQDSDCSFSSENLNKNLLGCPSTGCSNYASLAEAQAACCLLAECNGVVKNTAGFNLRKGNVLTTSSSGETAWVKSGNSSLLWCMQACSSRQAGTMLAQCRADCAGYALTVDHCLPAQSVDRAISKLDKAVVSCCPMDGNKTAVPRRSFSSFGCSGLKTYSEAEAFCTSLGMRLCQAEEVDKACTSVGLEFPYGVKFLGCFANEGSYRVRGHIFDQNWTQCTARSSFIGMEYPQGITTAGRAECLALSGLPNMTVVADSECAVEIDDQGHLLGGAYRLAVYGPAETDCVGYDSERNWVASPNSSQGTGSSRTTTTITTCQVGCDAPVQWDYPKCKPTCLTNKGQCPKQEMCNQRQGDVYRVGEQCWLALSYCAGCLERPAQNPTHLAPVPCQFTLGLGFSRTTPSQTFSQLGAASGALFEHPPPGDWSSQQELKISNNERYKATSSPTANMWPASGAFDKLVDPQVPSPDDRAVVLPSGQNSKFLKARPFAFPSGGSTIEARVQAKEPHLNRTFWLSYAVGGNDDCLLLHPPDSKVTNQEYSLVHVLIGVSACTKLNTEGRHAGTLERALSPSQASNGVEWAWQECAQRCGELPACTFWTLERTGTKQCLLLSRMGEYQASNGYYEGEVVRRCQAKDDVVWLGPEKTVQKGYSNSRNTCQSAVKANLTFLTNGTLVLYHGSQLVWASGQVIFYRDPDFLGESFMLGTGNYTSMPVGWNDVISSLRVPSGLSVTLFDEGNFAGTSVTCNTDTPRLGSFNDLTSSIRIQDSLVTCNFTIDNAVLGIWYNGVDIKSSVTGDLNSWWVVKTVKFQEVMGAKLALQGLNYEAATGASTCSTAGLLLNCSSVDPKSQWHGLVSDLGRIRAFGTPDNAPPAGWKDNSFNDSAFTKLCASSSGFSMAGAGSAQKVWASDKFGYFLVNPYPDSLVTCNFTIDNAVLGIWYNGVDIKSSVTGDLNSWWVVKTVKFQEVMGAKLALQGLNYEAATGASTCSTAGLLLNCSSVDPKSQWHGLVSDLGRIRAFGTPDNAPPAGWTDNSFNDSAFTKLCASSSGFSMAGAGSAQKVWASDKFGYFLVNPYPDTRASLQDPGDKLNMQADCNLVMYDTKGAAKWASVTLNQSWKGCQVILTNEGQAKIVDNQGAVRWIVGPKVRCRDATYWGCFANQAPNRVIGHIRDQSWASCAGRSEFFGMEYPEGYATVGNAECLPLSGLPNMTKMPDAECEVERNAQGHRLGGAYRLAVYGPAEPVSVYVNGVDSTGSMLYMERGFCGTTGGDFVVGNDQDSIDSGSVNDPAQASSTELDYMYVYQGIFDTAKIAERVAIGADGPDLTYPLYAGWSFAKLDGWDISGNRRDFNTAAFAASDFITAPEGVAYGSQFTTSNDYSKCNNFLGTEAEARARCNADETCRYLHDHNCDGQSWRYCSSITPQQGGPGCGKRKRLEKTESCLTGIPNGTVCCAASCGICDGSGCSGGPGGAASCCGEVILSSDNICTSRTEEACIIPGGPTPNNKHSWLAAEGTNVATAWLQLELPSPIVLRAIAISARVDCCYTQTPTGFVLRASNDGTSWDEVHTQPKGPSYSYSGETRWIEISSMSSHTAYRIYQLTGFQNDDARLSIGEWQLYSQSPNGRIRSQPGTMVDSLPNGFSRVSFRNAPGDDLAIYQDGRSADVCASECSEKPECQGFVYVPPWSPVWSSGTSGCALKKKISRIVATGLVDETHLYRKVKGKTEYARKVEVAAGGRCSVGGSVPKGCSVASSRGWLAHFQRDKPGETCNQHLYSLVCTGTGVSWYEGERTTTWDAAQAFCQVRGKALCRQAQVCPVDVPVGGAREGELWVAIADQPNEWLQVGLDQLVDRRTLCQTYSSLHGTGAVGPDWGKVSKPAYRKNLACCPGKDPYLFTDPHEKERGQVVQGTGYDVGVSFASTHFMRARSLGRAAQRNYLFAPLGATTCAAQDASRDVRKERCLVAAQYLAVAESKVAPPVRVLMSDPGDGSWASAPIGCSAQNVTNKQYKQPQTISDLGYGNRMRGWYDAQGQGICNDYCRYVGPGGGYSFAWFSCALAGSVDPNTAPNVYREGEGTTVAPCPGGKGQIIPSWSVFYKAEGNAVASSTEQQPASPYRLLCNKGGFSNQDATVRQRQNVTLWDRVSQQQLMSRDVGPDNPVKPAAGFVWNAAPGSLLLQPYRSYGLTVSNSAGEIIERETTCPANLNEDARLQLRGSVASTSVNTYAATEDTVQPEKHAALMNVQLDMLSVSHYCNVWRPSSTMPFVVTGRFLSFEDASKELMGEMQRDFSSDKMTCQVLSDGSVSPDVTTYPLGYSSWLNEQVRDEMIDTCAKDYSCRFFRDPLSLQARVFQLTGCPRTDAFLALWSSNEKQSLNDMLTYCNHNLRGTASPRQVEWCCGDLPSPCVYSCTLQSSMGWSLVRRISGSTATWFAAQDHATGTAESAGDPVFPTDDGNFTIKYNKRSYDHIKFAFGDESEWVIAPKAEVLKMGWPYVARVLASHLNPEPHQLNWYSRRSTLTTLGETVYTARPDYDGTKENGAGVLYRDFGEIDLSTGRQAHSGANVWVSCGGRGAMCPFDSACVQGKCLDMFGPTQLGLCADATGLAISQDTVLVAVGDFRGLSGQRKCRSMCADRQGVTACEVREGARCVVHTSKQVAMGTQQQAGEKASSEADYCWLITAAGASVAFQPARPGPCVKETEQSIAVLASSQNYPTPEAELACLHLCAFTEGVTSCQFHAGQCKAILYISPDPPSTLEQQLAGKCWVLEADSEWTGCERPADYCIQPDQHYRLVDCNQDGILDHTCYRLQKDTHGRVEMVDRSIITNRKNFMCEADRAVVANECSKAFGPTQDDFCPNSGERVFSIVDCDGDGTPDQTCVIPGVASAFQLKIYAARPDQCYLAYCNAYPDLQELFCSSQSCSSEVQMQACKVHWHKYGKSEGRRPDPEQCSGFVRLPRAKCGGVPITTWASGRTASVQETDLVFCMKTCASQPDCAGFATDGAHVCSMWRAAPLAIEFGRAVGDCYVKLDADVTSTVNAQLRPLLAATSSEFSDYVLTVDVQACPAAFGCERGQYCTQTERIYKEWDCNGDGVLDGTCRDKTGGRGIRLGGGLNNCANDNFPSAKAEDCVGAFMCPRDPTFCAEDGANYGLIDCNGDALLDHTCWKDTRKGVMLSLEFGKCGLNTWPLAISDSCKEAFQSHSHSPTPTRTVTPSPSPSRPPEFPSPSRTSSKTPSRTKSRSETASASPTRTVSPSATSSISKSSSQTPTQSPTRSKSTTPSATPTPTCERCLNEVIGSAGACSAFQQGLTQDDWHPFRQRIPPGCLHLMFGGAQGPDQCSSYWLFELCTENDCYNMVDDDRDGLVDCEDEDCLC